MFLCAVLASSILNVAISGYAQSLTRLRQPSRGSQPIASPGSVASIPQGTREHSATPPQNGYLPDRDATLSTGQQASFTNDSSRSSEGAWNRGINSAIDSETTRSTSGVDESEPTEATSYLAQESGKYNFINTAKEDELRSFIENSPGLCIVVPHRNFAPQDSSSQKETDKAASVVSSEKLHERIVHSGASLGGPNAVESASSIDSSFYDDYVVFTLTNLDPQETKLLQDSSDGEWSEFDLLDASLIAEGFATQESRHHYRSRFETLVSVLQQQTRNMQDQLQKTEKVYNFLHSHTLYSKYNLNCSSVAASLDSGVFNCVSATVLFNCFADRVGLNVAALETTGHAKSRVKFEDSFLDIETTCSSWNRLPDKIRPYQRVRSAPQLASENRGIPSSLDDESGVTDNNKSRDLNFSYVSFRSSHDESSSDDRSTTEEGSTTFRVDAEAPLGYSFTRSRRPMREITDVELVATIYYNVGVDYSQEGDYERSVASYIKAVQLAPSNQTILGNLKATINNWAIDVAMKEKDYEKAILITDLGRRIDPEFREYKMNMPIFYRDWIDRLTKEKKWDDAMRIQEEYAKRFPQSASGNRR